VIAHTSLFLQVNDRWQLPQAEPTKHAYTALKRAKVPRGDDDGAQRKERQRQRREADATSNCVHLEGVQAILREDTQRMRAEAMSLEVLVAAVSGGGERRETQSTRLQREVDELSSRLVLVQQTAVEVATEVRRKTEVLEQRIDMLRGRVRDVRSEGQGIKMELGEQVDTLRKLDAKTEVLRSRLARLQNGQAPWQRRVGTTKDDRA
jgi:chaperonin cofactor prefoldin